MRLIATFKDHEFPDKGYNHTRKIVRGIVYNDKFEIALIKCRCFDDFGERDLYETPGGGVEKGETLIEGFKREISEELGASIDRIEEIGRVVDFYNLIYRRNNNHFFLAHIKSLGEMHWTDKEKSWFEKVEYMSIDNAIKAYENTRNLPVNNIIRQRELPVLKIAKKRLNLIKEKTELRLKMIEIRRHIPDKLEQNFKIYVKLLNELRPYKTIGIYASMVDEVETDKLILSLLEMGKTIALPKVEKDNLIFFKISSLDNLVISNNKYKIREPIARNELLIQKNEIDAIVIPALAFDKNKNRLGFGQGYYDRYLKGYKGIKIGVCYKEQIINDVPINKKDEIVDKIITSK